MTSKRKAFSLEDKIRILKDVEAGKKKADICREKEISSSTLSTILKNKEKIMSAGQSFSSKSKKLRTATNKELDSAMVKWFSANRSANVPISGPLLQEKAKQFSQALGGSPDFKASSGWMSRFKARHNISSGKICGEAKSVSKDVVDNWLGSWPAVRQNYSDDDIFNADEMGLFFKLMPDKTLKFKNERCIGGKLSKERITVLACANMSGTEKRKLLVVGKSEKPRCFRCISQLPVTYKFNKKSWMTSEIFTEELLKWDRQLGNRRILLIVDNCTAHPKINGLRNIELLFLPPNCTSILQPMDQGIIRSIKVHYRKLLVRRMLDSVEKKTIPTVSLLDAIHFVHKAWSLVETKTIKNCFSHAGWTKAHIEDTEEDNIPLSEWLKLQLRGQEDFIELNNLEMADFITVDDAVIVCDLPTDNDIIAEVRGDNSIVVSDESEDEDLPNEIMQVIPTKQEVENAMKTIRLFIQTQDTASEEVYNCFTCLDNMIDKMMLLNKFKQSKITDFFQQQQ